MEMFDGLKIYGSGDYLEGVTDRDALFICAVATTETSKIPGITGAGASPELTEYTPAADVELIVHDAPRCLPEIPQTIVEGEAAPTPAVITKAALELAEVPFLVADAGASVKPDVPYININSESGGDIRTGRAVSGPAKIYERGLMVGRTLSCLTEHLVVGESTPAGTTTALGVLTALGYDADFRVSASMPHNPHDLKREVVMAGLSNAGIEKGDCRREPFRAVEAVGDPMIPAVAGICMGSTVPVTLAGGTQMTAVCALMKAIDPEFDFSDTAIATTIFVAEDSTSDINRIADQIGDIDIYAVDPDFGAASHRGLHEYLSGSVKEGVGAGGAMLLALLHGIPVEMVRERIEELCNTILA